MTMLPCINGKQIWCYDIEVFSNYFLFNACNGDDWVKFDHNQLHEMVEFVSCHDKIMAGYNNFSYDDIVIKQICKNLSSERQITIGEIKELSDAIIGELQPNIIFGWTWDDPPWAYSIDIFALLNKKMGLKELECRMQLDIVDELAHDFTKPIEDADIPDVISYCDNDVKATMKALLSNMELVYVRDALIVDYGLMTKVHCMPEQGVAQHLFMTLHKQRTGQTSSHVRDKAARNPDNLASVWALSDLTAKMVAYHSPVFQSFFARWMAGRVVAKDPTLASWSLDYDSPAIETFADKQFSIGVGGLHSIDQRAVFTATDDCRIIDLDVASYYPNLICTLGLYPKQIGPEYAEDMRVLTARRIHAKRTGNKRVADSLKIVLNSTFGKLNDPYSPLRSIPDAMRVTLNGQLMILMLVEDLYLAGFEILSANTDGVTIRCSKSLMESSLTDVTAKWETTTKMSLERSDYVKYIRRDVNSYIAVTDHGKIKYKGATNKDSGKADGVIVKLAAEEYLINGTSPIDTIAQCKDVRKFLFYLRSKNGGIIHHGSTRIGKSARWLVVKNGLPLTRLNPPTAKRKETRIGIPNADNVIMAMDLTTLGEFDSIGLNLSYYEDAAWNLIRSIIPSANDLAKILLKQSTVS